MHPPENPPALTRSQIYYRRNKERKKAYQSRYRILHAETIKNYLQEWRNNNKEKIQALNKAYYETHREELRLYNKDYHVKHQKKRTAGSREYWAKHKETLNAKRRLPEPLRLARQQVRLKKREALRDIRLNAYRQRRRTYAKTHPHITKEVARRRRARKKMAPRVDLTGQQWQEIQTAYRFRCVYCGKKPKQLTQDHIIPLKFGGSHTVSNIVPACLSCNSKKSAGPPPVPVQPLLFTIAVPRGT